MLEHPLNDLGTLAQALFCFYFFRLAWAPVASISTADQTELDTVRDYASGCVAILAFLTASSDPVAPVTCTLKVLGVLSLFFVWQRSNQILQSIIKELDNLGEEIYLSLRNPNWVGAKTLVTDVSTFVIKFAKLAPLKLRTFVRWFDRSIKQLERIARLHTSPI